MKCGARVEAGKAARWGGVIQPDRGEGTIAPATGGGDPGLDGWITLSEEAVAGLLVGLPVEISVGEPWDFESPDGRNALKGRIAAVGQDDPDDPASQWVKVEVTPFADKGGKRVEHLKARRRYKLPTGIIDQITSGRGAMVHLHYGDGAGGEDLPDGTGPYLIGGMRLMGRGAIADRAQMKP